MICLQNKLKKLHEQLKFCENLFGKKEKTFDIESKTMAFKVQILLLEKLIALATAENQILAGQFSSNDLIDPLLSESNDFLSLPSDISQTIETSNELIETELGVRSKLVAGFKNTLIHLSNMRDLFQKATYSRDTLDGKLNLINFHISQISEESQRLKSQKAELKEKLKSKNEEFEASQKELSDINLQIKDIEEFMKIEPTQIQNVVKLPKQFRHEIKSIEDGLTNLIDSREKLTNNLLENMKQFGSKSHTDPNLSLNSQTKLGILGQQLTDLSESIQTTYQQEQYNSHLNSSVALQLEFAQKFDR